MEVRTGVAEVAVLPPCRQIVQRGMPTIFCAAPVVVPILAWRFGAAIQRQIRVRVAWPRRRWVQLHGKETAGGGHFDDLDKVGRVWHLAAGGLLRAGEEHCQYSSNQDGRFQGIFHSCFLSI